MIKKSIAETVSSGAISTYTFTPSAWSSLWTHPPYRIFQYEPSEDGVKTYGVTAPTEALPAGVQIVAEVAFGDLAEEIVNRLNPDKSPVKMMSPRIADAAEHVLDVNKKIKNTAGDILTLMEAVTPEERLPAIKKIIKKHFRVLLGDLHNYFWSYDVNMAGRDEDTQEEDPLV